MENNDNYVAGYKAGKQAGIQEAVESLKLMEQPEMPYWNNVIDKAIDELNNRIEKL